MRALGRIQVQSHSQVAAGGDNDSNVRNEKQAERAIASDILTTSSVMMGLCLTIITVMRSAERAGRVATIVDDVVAVDALVFLVSCFSSYFALRSRRLPTMKTLESIADTVFLFGMVGIGAACALFVWTIL